MERNRAEWIKKNDKYHTWNECSCCGMRTLKSRPEDRCPHCGSSMIIRKKVADE